MENKEELKSILDALNLQLEQSRELLDKAYTAIGEKRPEKPVPVFDELPEYEVLDLALPSRTKWVYLKEGILLSEMEKYAKFFPTSDQRYEFSRLYSFRGSVDDWVGGVNGKKIRIPYGAGIFVRINIKELTAEVYVVGEHTYKNKFIGDKIHPLLVLPNP